MALQFSETVRNARLNAFESSIGTTPKLQLLDGSLPADCATADAGTILCQMTLPSDWMSNAAAGVKSLLGTWEGTGAAAAGAGINATHFRLLNSAGTICHCQGNVTITGGAGPMEIDDLEIIEDQPVTVTAFALTEGNA